MLSETIRQWDAETDEKRLEQQFLLKELCIGRRNEHVPSWSGAVTRMRTQQVIRRKVCWHSLRVAGLCVGVDDYQQDSQRELQFCKLENAVRDAEAVDKALRRTPGCNSAAIRNPKTATELRYQLRTHLQEPDLAKDPPELFVVYYAGHGFLQYG